MPLVEPEPPSSNAVGNRSHITRTHDLEQSVVNLRAKSDGNAASSFTFTGVSCAICLSCSHRLYKGHLLNRNVLAALGVSEECASRNARSTSVGALLLRAVVLLSLPFKSWSVILGDQSVQHCLA